MTELIDANAVRLNRDVILHLPDDLSARYRVVDSIYWDERDRHAELTDGRILSIFDYDSTWTWWERHPTGDELAHLLTGQVELLLEDEFGCRTDIQLAQGESTIIPTGAWHSVRVIAPSSILFVTPTPASTEHRSA
jgi:uncharacterized cupin superfamily protein